MLKSAFRIILALHCLGLSVQAQYITHGPVIGALTDTSARIYLRSSASAQIEIQLSGGTQSLKRIMAQTISRLDHAVIVPLIGLQPSTIYQLRFYVNGAEDSLRASFKTFPASGSRTPLVFTTGSCQESENMKTFDRMAEVKPDLFIHTGDFTYPSYQMNDDYPGKYSAVSESYRRRYEEKRMKEMLRNVPIDYVPDDDDLWGGSRKYGLARTTYRLEERNGKKVPVNFMLTDTFPDQGRINCLKGYREFFPGFETPDPEALYHSFKAGNCEFFFLDTRSTADGQMSQFKYDTASNHWSFVPSDSVHIISRQQMQWLKNGLAASKADWKFIVCGLPFNRSIKYLIDLGIKLQDVVYGAAGETGTGFRIATSFATYWAGYPADQEELLEFVSSHGIKDVLVISGDTHHNVMDNGRNAGLPELNASGLAVAGTHLAYYMNLLSVVSGWPGLKKYLWNGGGGGLGNKNFKNQFGQIEVDGHRQVSMKVVDEDGKVLAKQVIPHSSTLKQPKSRRIPLYQKRLERRIQKSSTPMTNLVKAVARMVYKPERKKRS